MSRTVTAPLPFARSLRLAHAAVPLSLALCMCGHPLSRAARIQSTAQEFNLNARFGRNELVTLHVAPAARAAFAAKHRAWGGEVRIAEIEIAQIVTKSDNDFEVFVNVQWYRPNQSDLRTTVMKESWHDDNGMLVEVDETRMDGDFGLLGEPVTIDAPQVPPIKQFPTIRLGEQPSSVH